MLDLFRQWDTDDSGFIDCKEFGQALQSMGFVCSKKDVAIIYSDLDPDGSSKLDYKELNASLRTSLQRKQSPVAGRKKAGASKRTAKPQ